MIKITCPNGCVSNFEVSATVAQTWEVDATGEFVAVLQDCTDVVHKPDKDDLWFCQDCGDSANVT